MKIAIDMRSLQTRGMFRGVGVHWREILRQLAVIDSRNQYFLLYASNCASADDQIRYPANFKRIFIRIPRFPRGSAIPWLWLIDPVVRARLMEHRQVDVFVDTTFADLVFPSAPLSGCRNLLWIYDLIPWIFQDRFVARQRLAFLKRMMLRIKLANATRATAVITSSESTRQDFHTRSGYSLDRVKVVPLGVDPLFFDPPAARTGELRGQPELPDRYILFVGALDPHKNLPLALEAYAQVSRLQEIPPLLIVGRVDTDRHIQRILTGQLIEMGLTDRVRFLDWLTVEHLAAVYSAADYLLFPTLYEGFGLPALEAMAAGCPVLTSNVSSLPEVVGDCAVLVDPLEARSIADGMLLLGSDPDFRKNLAGRGRHRARNFTWRRTAESFLSCLEDVGGGAGRSESSN